MSYKINFSLAAIYNWKIEHMHIKTAFLYSKIDEEVYVEQPTGFTKDNQVCHLKKTLYGLKQSPQIWYTKIATFLTEQDYKATDANHAVFTKYEDSIAFYVDNLLLVGPNVNRINNFKQILNKTFKMTNLGPCRYYLGIQITQDCRLGTIHLNQTEYVK